MSPLRTAPVTAECLIVCAALFVVCQIQTLDQMRFLDAQRQWGAALSLQFPARDGPPEAIHRQLTGPFDLWDGQWWRIPVNSFHHANALHLLVNCFAAWSLGRRLERRWGSLRLALFLLPTTVITPLIELLIGNAAVGFSGSICAMLGALIVLQAIDPREDDISNESIQMVLALLLLGIPATTLDVLSVANAAHISGIVYGWVAAWLCCGLWSHPRLVRAGFVMVHLVLIPAVWAAAHPFHNGRYLWYLAVRDRVAPAEREPLLRRAIHADPSLTGVWLRLADHRMIEGEPHAAWTLVIAGLSHNPADEDLVEAARSIWRRLPHGPARDIAEAELRRVFGERAPAWSRQIRITGLASAKPGNAETRPPNDPALDPKNFPLDQPIDLHWQPQRHEIEPSRPVDPDQPDSASEGAAL